MKDRNGGSVFSRRTFVKGAAVAGAAAIGASALQGCGGGSSSGGGTPSGGAGGGDSKAGGTLAYYISQPAFIDPFDLQESEGTQVSSNLFDSLVDYDFVTGELVPAAAESWEISEDATVFTFKLREGAKFHNGDPVTAKDFKFGWERIVNPNTAPDPSAISYHLGMVKGFDELLSGGAKELSGVVALDDLTLEVTLTQAYADFIFVCMHPALCPVPTGGAAADYKTYSRAPIGNGPFKIKGEWVDDQYIQVERFDDYYGEKPLLDAVDFKIYQSPENAFNDFQAGNLDFTQIPPGQISAAVAEYGESADGWTVQPGKQCLLGEESSTYYLVINNNDPVLKDKGIRTAISYAINRQAICDTVFDGTRAPADGIIPPGIAGFHEGAWDTAVYDVEKAKAALSAAGFEGGEGIPTIKLSFNTGGGHEDIMQLIQADLAAIGIKAELNALEWAAYLDALQAGQIQIGRLGWIADYPIADNFAYALFYSESGDNNSKYNNPAVDAKILEARQITDTDARVKAYQDIDKLIAADVPVVPVMFYKHSRVGSQRLNDFFFGPNMIADLPKAWLTK